MGRLKAILSEVRDTIGDLPHELQSAALQALLPEVIRDIRGPQSGGGRTAGHHIDSSHSVISGPLRFTKFLADYSISTESLNNVLDIESGHILVRNPASTKADSSRRLAALLSLVNAKKTGEFTVDRDTLVSVCEDHGVYDRANFSTHMKEFQFNGSVVFIKVDNGYRVSVPGEAFVAFVVKTLGGGAEPNVVTAAPSSEGGLP